MLRGAFGRKQGRRPATRVFSELAAAHSSWFKLEDQGMKEFELLARGSGFYVRGPTTGTMMALVSAHVAAPHRFPSYFPHEWLQHVRDSDCRTLLETRSADGRKVSGVTSVQPLHVGYRHTSLDVAAFVLHDVTAESILNAGLQILKLDDDDATHIGERVKIGGYRLQGESGSGTESVLKVELEGEVTERNKYRGFVDTGNVDSEMGMCGGPVVLNGAPEICLGLLEGLVPRPEKEQVAEEAHRRLAGKSVFIGARELKMFLHDVETDNAQESRKRSKATAMPDK